MANWISWVKDDLGTGGTTRDGMITNGPSHGIQLSTDLPPLTGITTCTTLHLAGQLKDGDNDFGSSGQVLSSDGTDTKWVNAGSLSAGAASQVAIGGDNNTNADRFVTFVDSASGNNSVKTDASLKYNPSTNTITTVNITGNVNGNASGSSGSCTGNAATATKLATARNIGGVSFDGSAAINLPGVNAGGNQDTSGNAATATALETARNIGGVSFDGTAAINLPGVNQAGNQDTSGNAATATTLETTRSFSIGGEITANAVNFNGSGNVSFSATIDNNIVDEANLRISNTGTNGQFLCKRSGNTGGMTWETVSNSASALSGGTLASGITNSSLTSLGTLTALTVANDISVDSVATIGQSNNTRNLKIQAIGSGTDIGISGYDSAGNWRYQLYGSATGGYGFLTANWGSWDIRKIVNGEMRLRVGGSDYIVWHQGNDGDSSGLAAETAARLSTTRSIGGVNFDGSGNINLPGVNTAGNQNTSGNAATATEVYQTVNTSTNNYAVLFSDTGVSGGSGNKGVQHDSNTFWYNPGNNTLTVQYFSGSWNQLPSGTRMLFNQTNAPTGWTKDTSSTNRALRLVSGTVGTGGSNTFTGKLNSSVTTSGGNPLALTLSTNQIPSHRHWISSAGRDDANMTGTGSNTQDYGLFADQGSHSFNDPGRTTGRNTAYTGGGQAHDHGFTQPSFNLNIAYTDVMIAQKD